MHCRERARSRGLRRATALARAALSVVQFSGHGLKAPDGSRRLAFEMEDGTIQLPDAAKFVELLKLLPRLEGVPLWGSTMGPPWEPTMGLAWDTAMVPQPWTPTIGPQL